jgi:hypothetical protein
MLRRDRDEMEERVELRGAGSACLVAVSELPVAAEGT